jgi:response regulator RpfG family c-di-GMP phosphodiesterase
VAQKIERIRKPGEAGTVLLAGVSDYEMRKMGKFLESRGFSVLQALDEKDAAKTVRKEWPDFILMEYWEDDALFDAVALFKFLAASPDTKKIPCAFFCNSALRNDAAKSFSTKNILAFSSVKDLLEKLEALLRLPEFKRSGH